jgi:hypothetical protein
LEALFEKESSMTFWHSIPDIIERLANDTGKAITEKQVLTAALNGGIRLAAENPLWCEPGEGELRWFRPDGEIVGLHSVVTDGVVRWITGLKLEVLIRRGNVSLSGTQWQCGDTLLTACKDSPVVTMADIRVPETNYPALLTAFGDVVVVRVPAKEKNPHRQWKVPGTWQFIAREIGKKWMLEEEVRTGKRPVVVKIARYVEGELSNRNIKNVRGTFPDAGSVKRDALTGITGRQRTGKK